MNLLLKPDPEALVNATRTALFTLAMATLVACHPAGNDNPEEAEKARRQALEPRPVTLVAPEVREEVPTLELVGDVRAFDSVAISAEVAGRVDRVLVEVGDPVVTGEALVEVDQETFRLQLAQAEANVAAAAADLELAERNLERKRDLLSDKTIPQAVFDEAKASQDLASARLGAAEAARDLARHDLDRSVIRAPAAGVVSGRMVVAGQWADVGAALLEVALGDTVKVAARVPESWAPRLAGLEGFDFSVGGKGSTHHAKLYSIDPVVQESSRSFTVVGTATARGQLRPGMFATIRLRSPETLRSLWVPVSAVSISDLPKVLMAADGEVVERAVQTGRRDGDMLEVVSGLAVDERVIADVSGLHRGLPVEVEES